MPIARPQLVVLMAATALLGSCSLGNLFHSSGTPCLDDINCPDNQVCCSGQCAAKCVGGTLVTTVTFATDFMPGYEFNAIVLVLGSASRTVNVNAVTELTNPRPVAQFTEMAAGDHQVVVQLQRDDALVVARTVRFTMTSDTTVPVIVTRNSAVCAVDEDCQSSAACVQGVCVSGSCLEQHEDGLCGADERCLPGAGCAAQVHECDFELQCDDLTSCTQERCNDGRCVAIRDDSRCGATICDPSAKTADPSTGCTPAPCSADNCIAAPCETTACVSGACVHTSVCASGQQCCDGVCAANCNDPRACAGRNAGYVCRVATGACDVAEVCDGVSEACPPNVVIPAGTVCRANSGLCDIPESCNGTSPACPANTVAGAGTVCRAQNGACDVAEACTGASSACPVDVFVDVDTVCRPSAGVCDVAEACTGVSPACPSDAFRGPTVVCRPPAGVCDIADTCSGASASCPGDTRVTPGTVCHASAGVCDVAETCTGGTACPIDGFVTGGTQCRGSTGSCDPAEACTGSSAACPGNSFVANGSYCADGGTCLYYTCNNGACNAVVPRNEGASCDAASCGMCTTGACSYQSCEQYFGGYCAAFGVAAGGCTNLIALNRYVGSPDHWTTTGGVSAGYTLEGSMGNVFTSSVPGTRALYDCLVNGTDHMLSGDPACEGTAFVRTEGWLYSQPQANTHAIYRCVIVATGDHFVSPYDTCEGFLVEYVLGYAL